MEDLKKAAADLNQKTAEMKAAGQEPLSGEQGAGTAAEPFDQGNSEGKDGKSALETTVDSVNETKAKISESMTGK